MRHATSEERERYARASAILNDARLAAQYARIGQTLAATAQPAGKILNADKVLKQSRRVGLLAGSFNPLTRAHVALGNAARTVGRLDSILWALSVVTVDKERVECASLVDRLLQMRAFVGEKRDALALINRGLYVELAEVAQTLTPHLEALFIVVGFDKIVQILDRRYYDDRDATLDRLFAHAAFLVAPRADEDEASLNALLSREENRRYRGRISFCPLLRRFRGDSSTKARALVGEPGCERRLCALLPPEAQALAEVTRAYWHEIGSANREQLREDSYPLRQEIIEGLAGLEPAQTVDTPGLNELLSMRKDLS